MRERNSIFERSNHGLSGHPLYQTWNDIRNRCYNTLDEDYIYYGARGIEMKDTWIENPTAFIKYIERYLGFRPTSEHTLDRINNERGYFPGNLRWATRSQQMQNARKPLRMGNFQRVANSGDLNKIRTMLDNLLDRLELIAEAA